MNGAARRAAACAAIAAAALLVGASVAAAHPVAWRVVGVSPIGSTGYSLIPKLDPTDTQFAGIATALPASSAQPAVEWWASSQFRAIVFEAPGAALRFESLLPQPAARVRAVLERAVARTNFAYRRLVMLSLLSMEGCCPPHVAALTENAGRAALVLQPSLPDSCVNPPPGTAFCAFSGPMEWVVLLALPRAQFDVPRALTVTLGQRAWISGP